ncbi:MAG TPA: hypothetical protein VF171_03265 [Trueperaceae bacterium]
MLAARAGSRALPAVPCRPTHLLEPAPNQAVDCAPSSAGCTPGCRLRKTSSEAITSLVLDEPTTFRE